MHKLTFFLCIQILLISVSYAQSPFGTLGNRWTYEGWSEGSGWEPNWQGDCQGNMITYETVDDLMIDGINCGIITSNKTNDSLIMYQENGEVYFYENSQFYKLYDFTASVGDTVISFRPSNADSHSLKDFFGFQQEEFDTVDTIYTLINNLDTIVVNGRQLKRWSTEVFHPDLQNTGAVRRYSTIVENIGPTNGLLGDHDLFIGSGCYGGFVCYESEDFTLGSYRFPMCEFTSSIEEIGIIQLSIYPNPVVDILRVESENSEIIRIEAYNLSGQKILETENNMINMESYDPGMYVLKIRDVNELTVIRKIIKQ